MRVDLSPAFNTAKNLSGRSPRQLAVFHFPIAGDLYLSDQELGAADGLNDEYAALVEDWGELIDMAGGDPSDQKASEIRQLTLTIWNGGQPAFSDYFLQEDPEDVEVEVFQWFIGLTDSDKVLIDRFVIQDPISFGEASRLLRLDLVSLSMRYDNPIGDLLSADDWTNAKTGDIGKGINLVIGTPGPVSTLCACTAPEVSLNGSILATTMTITVHENLNDLAFLPSGAIQISEEKIRYSSRTQNTFNVIQRGWTTEAVEHLDGDKVIQFVEDFTYLVGKGPIQAINNVKVAGIPAPDTIYTVHPDLDPVRIVFTEKPYSVQYAKGTRFLEMHFDDVNSDNTAKQPHLAYDAASRATAALINPTNPKLSIKQSTENANRGEMIKVYLAVEHWESAVFAEDYVEVFIEGVGVIGRLSRPNPDDITDVQGEVDIDHHHSHAIAGEHTHYFTDPTIRTKDPSHGHASEGIGSTTTYYPGESMGFYLYAFEGDGQQAYRNFPGCPTSWVNATLIIRSSFHGAGLRINGQSIGSGEQSIGLGPRSLGYAFQVHFQAIGWGVVGGYSQVHECRIVVTVDSTVLPAYSAVSTKIQTSGQNADASDKKEDDVEDLETENVGINITGNDTSTRTIVNLFDVTEHANFDWSWFTNRDVTVEYKGSAESKNVYLLHVFFDVEYRKKEIIFSDDVTCEPTGIIDDASGKYTGTPDALITRPDHVRKYLLCDRGDLPETFIDLNNFTASGLIYTADSYIFDGVLNANLTVRETEKKLARQCRSRWFWNAGKAKIAVREKMIDWTVNRSLLPSDMRLKSISVERQKVTDLANKIQLFYDRDWTSDESGSSGFRSNVFEEDPDSITAHGICEDREGFLFDCVKSQPMARDLVEYYIELLASPSSFYQIDTYLPQFDLEKEDIIDVTANFQRLSKARMAIRALNRVFGSGKTKNINLIRIFAECIRYIIHEVNLEDTVGAIDQLSIDLGRDIDLAEALYFVDQLITALGITVNDGAAIADTLEVLASYSPELMETISVSDVITCAMNILLEDDVIIEDIAEAWRLYGFGGGGYGDTGFGGYTIWKDQSPDQVRALDMLHTALSMHIGYRPGIDYTFGNGPFGESEFGGYPEHVRMSDELYFSDGFGGLKVGGFGAVPYGN